MKRRTGRRPSARDLKEEARGRFEEALEAYEAFNTPLKRKPIRPGYFWRDRKWRLRGEYANVPRRYLDLKAAPRDVGNEDDQAHEFGFETGDELLEHLARLHRPTLAEFMREGYANPVNARDRQAALRDRKGELGKCSRCPAPARPGKANCAACNEAAKEAMRERRARLRADRQPPVDRSLAERIAEELEAALD